MAARIRGGGNHASAVPAVIADRFGISHAPSRDLHPTVERVLYPDAREWVPVAGQQRVSTSYLRKIRAAGAFAVEMRSGSRVVTFEMKGLVK